MKSLHLLPVIIFFATATTAQTVNQITIYPTNPAFSDTIYVVSDFSYNGNCTYGMTYLQSWMIGSSVYLLPTYCGYGAPTSCNSIDTFKIDPLPDGIYNINIEYHQGSVCPVSGFDATIAQFDTIISVGDITSVSEITNTVINIYPNPANDYVKINYENLISVGGLNVKIINLSGQQVFEGVIDKNNFEIKIPAHQSKGTYFLHILNEQGKSVEIKKMIIN